MSKQTSSLDTLKKKFDNAFELEWKKHSAAKAKLTKKTVLAQMKLMREINRLLPKSLAWDLSREGLENERSEFADELYSRGLSKDEIRSSANNDIEMYEHMVESVFSQLEDYDEEE